MSQEALPEMSRWKKAGLLLVAALLFWEILKALPEFTATDRIGTFFFGFTLFLFLRSTRFTLWVQVPLVWIIIHYLMNSIFYPHLYFVEIDWYTRLISDAAEEWEMMDFGSFFTARYPVIRSFCFFVVLWLVSK